MNVNQKSIERLQQCGIKPSMQRIAILNYLMENLTHPAADEVFSELYPEIPTLSKTTVYNTLKLLAQHGAAMEIDIDEKMVRYDGNTMPHAHFKCKECGRIYDMPLPELPELPNRHENEFNIDEQQIYYKGFCKKCKAA